MSITHIDLTEHDSVAELKSSLFDSDDIASLDVILTPTKRSAETILKEGLYDRVFWYDGDVQEGLRPFVLHEAVYD